MFETEQKITKIPSHFLKCTHSSPNVYFFFFKGGAKKSSLFSVAHFIGMCQQTIVQYQEEKRKRIVESLFFYVPMLSDFWIKQQNKIGKIFKN